CPRRWPAEVVAGDDFPPGASAHYGETTGTGGSFTMRVRRVSVVAGLATLAVGALMLTTPAAAATLPKSQNLTTVVQFFDPDNELLSTTQMFDTSPVDASGTPIGDPDGPFILTGIDVDDDGLGYAIQIDITDEFGSPVLWQADANTGVFSNPVEIVATDPQILLTHCEGIDYQPGVQIVVACFSFLGGDGPESSYIGVVTPDGAFTPFISSGGEDEIPVVIWQALAHDPVTGQLWAFGVEL